MIVFVMTTSQLNFLKAPNELFIDGFTFFGTGEGIAIGGFGVFDPEHNKSSVGTRIVVAHTFDGGKAEELEKFGVSLIICFCNFYTGCHEGEIGGGAAVHLTRA